MTDSPKIGVFKTPVMIKLVSSLDKISAFSPWIKLVPSRIILSQEDTNFTITEVLNTPMLGELVKAEEG